MLFDFLGLLFESRLPFLVLFLLLSSSKRLPSVFLYMQIYISPLCCISSTHLDLIPCSTEICGELHVVFCRPPVSRSQLTPYASAACGNTSWRSTSLPIFKQHTSCFTTNYTCSFYFLENSFFWDRFHSIPPAGFAALKSCRWLVQKLAAYLLLSAAGTLWFCFASHIS